MKYEWVVGLYRPGSASGQSVLALAEAGLGYHLINQQRDKHEDVIVGFQRPTNAPRPHHLRAASASQVASLIKLEETRN